MKALGWLSFLPDEAMPLLIAVAGLLMIVGFRRHAIALLTLCLVMAFAPILLDPLFAVLPTWATIGIAVLGLWSLLPRRKKKRKE